MQKFIAICGAAIASLGAAHAQGIDGGNVALATYSSEGSDNDSWDATQFAGSIEVGVGSALSIQGDLATSEEGGNDASSLGVHLVYDVSPETAVGLFVVSEEWNGVDAEISGLEVAADLGGSRGISVEGVLANYSWGGWDYNLMAVNASVPVTGRIDFVGGLSLGSGDWEATILEGGARYNFSEGLSVQGTIALGEDGGGYEWTSFLIEGNFDFGKGVTFGRRAWMDLYPGSL